MDFTRLCDCFGNNNPIGTYFALPLALYVIFSNLISVFGYTLPSPKPIYRLIAKFLGDVTLFSTAAFVSMLASFYMLSSVDGIQGVIAVINGEGLASVLLRAWITLLLSHISFIGFSEVISSFRADPVRGENLVLAYLAALNIGVPFAYYFVKSGM